MINMALRHLRQKAFEMPSSKFKQLNVGGKNWAIYDNTNFSVHITDKCNADCAFCIAHLRYLNDGNVYVKPEMNTFDAYLRGLDSSLKLVSDISPSVSITGGEPTVSPKFSDIIDVLIANDVRKKTITTNGSGLMFKVANGKTVFDKLVDYKLDYLNISRAHWNEELNSKLMVMKKDLAPNDLIKDVIKQAKIAGIKTRLSCALLKEGIKNLDDILKYLEWAREVGADAVIFRQLMKFNEQKVLPGRIPLYCKDQEVELPEIWDAMDSSGQFLLNHQVLGYYYYVEVREFNGMSVVSEAADLNLIPVQLDRFSKQMNTPTAFELVYHPNGNMCAGWNENEMVMYSAQGD